MIVSSLHQLGHLLAHLGWVANDVDAGGFQSCDLLGSSALASSDDGTSVAHAAAWGCSLSSNEADNRQVAVVVGREPLGSLLLSLATDLANHDDTLGLGIVNELGKHINEVGTVEGVTSNTDNGRLTETLRGSLIDGLVSESTGARDNTDFTLGVNISRHDTDLALARLDDTWAVRADQTSLSLRVHDRLDLDHVKSGNTLGDADNKVHLGLDSLEDGISSEGRRHIDDRSLGIGGLLALGNGAENGQTEMLGASLALVDTADDLGAVSKSLLSVEGTLESAKEKPVSWSYQKGSLRFAASLQRAGNFI